MERESFDKYLKRISRRFHAGDATEHTHRGALEDLVRSQGWSLETVNEPKRVACGAPDILVLKDLVPAGHMETKDIGADLDKAEKSDQLRRYRESLANLILTDYLEFRWYVDGERRLVARLGTLDRDGRIVPDPEGIEAVATLLAFFRDKEVPILVSAREVAARMAGLARLIRHTIGEALEQEKREAPAKGKPVDQMPIHEQLAAFRQVLIHDLPEADFSDMYAQTICYGLFAARFEVPREKNFDRRTASFHMPATNPFLAKTFVRIGGVELDERVAWAVDDLAEVLNRTDMDAIRAEFRSRGRREDPVVHFYEDFLAAYDPKTREARGVYYTPEPVVAFIVRSVDSLLKTEFGLAEGLKDAARLEDGTPRVHVLDPAAGTGTFLHGVVDFLFTEYFAGNEGLWPRYAREHLLPRLHGFELLMAPYAIAHLKLNLKLKETFCELHGGERVNVFLTNALEEPHVPERPPMFAGWLTDEARAASKVKRDLPVMVVLGNPPYSGHSGNPSERERPTAKGERYETYSARSFRPGVATATRDMTVRQRTFIGHLLRGWDELEKRPTGSYYHLGGEPLGEKNPKWLNNDYVKFIRFGQWRIERTGSGILAFITSNSYLDGPTHRAMRRSLLENFDEIFVLDLHGNAKKKETAPDGGADGNVFDITEGVAILLLVKRPGGGKGWARLRHADLWGEREVHDRPRAADRRLTGGKYAWLRDNGVATTAWTELAPVEPLYLFVPRAGDLVAEYERGWSLAEVFPINVVGFQTHRDHFAISFDQETMARHLSRLVEASVSDETLRAEFALKDNRDWKLSDVRKKLRSATNPVQRILRCDYRPFDKRFGYFDEAAMDYPRRELKVHVANRNNICLLSSRQQGVAGYQHCLVADAPANDCVVSNRTREANQVFPLYRYPDPDGGFDLEGPSGAPDGRRPNLAAGFMAEAAERLGLAWLPDGAGDLEAFLGPEDLFHYIYAVLHAPSYRVRYAELLKSDFPRIPLTGNRVLFRTLAGQGRRLAALHLMKEAGAALPRYPVPGTDGVEKVRYAEERVWINATQHFDGVSQAVWEFRVGGYQPCEKWLKDRRGRVLSHGDIEHYRRIAAALAETIDLMAAIDAAIAEAGGWPLEQFRP